MPVYEPTLGRNLLHEHPAGYAELYENSDAGDAITITTAGTFYKWTGGTKGTCADSFITTSAGGSNNNFTLKNGADGIYAVLFSVSFTGGKTTSTYHWSIFQNGTQVTKLQTQTKNPSATNTTKNDSNEGILKLVAGDVVDLRVTSDASSDSVTVYHANLMIRMITPFLPS